MTEQTQAQADANPFDSGNFSHGGGLWDGKTITVTSARVIREAMTYKDGKPVLDGKSGQQSILIALRITGIAEGGDDKERKEDYSAGGKVVPTADGEGFTTEDGSPLKFHANSNIAKFSAALKEAGFDIGSLLVRDTNGAIVMLAPGIPKQQFSKLVGARIIMRAEAKVGKDGKTIKDKGGYDKQTFLPAKFIGYASGVAQQGVTGGNGAASGNGSALVTKADAAVLKALSAGPLTRAQLVAALATQLAGDPEGNAVIGLVVNDGFHKGKAWKYDGVQASL